MSVSSQVGQENLTQQIECNRNFFHKVSFVLKKKKISLSVNSYETVLKCKKITQVYKQFRNWDELEPCPLVMRACTVQK